jgi:hypothetical protein
VNQWWREGPEVNWEEDVTGTRERRGKMWTFRCQWKESYVGSGVGRVVCGVRRIDGEGMDWTTRIARWGGVN